MGFNLALEKEGLKSVKIYTDINSEEEFWNLPLFDEMKRLQKVDFDNRNKKPELPKSGESCNKCGSENTYVLDIQTRGGDEGKTFFVLCGDCASSRRT